MKRVAAPRLNEDNLTPQEVAGYLRRHPGFFADHLELLESMTVPHPSGVAISLVSRQLDLLRAKNQRLLKQLDGLLQIARENDALNRRIHQLTLALLDANSVADVLASLDWGLHQYFQVDFVAVRLLAPRLDHPVRNLFLPERGSETDWCEGIVAQSKPVCGKLEPEHAAILFGEDARRVASHAIAALRHAGIRGLFAIGSRDPERFREDLGFVFLGQMSEILAARLSVLLNAQG